MTVSLGVASVVNGNAEELPVALKNADAALYDSKHAGRDRVTVHLPPSSP